MFEKKPLTQATWGDGVESAVVVRRNHPSGLEWFDCIGTGAVPSARWPRRSHGQSPAGC